MSRTLSWSAAAVLGIAVLFLLVRNSLAIPVLVPLDPNEGWNAAHALALRAGHGLYPSPQSLMVNNYPPLSFYPVAFLTGWTGDAVIAGRALALLSFLADCALIAALTRRMGAGMPGRILAPLFFAGILLIASDYVGMNDPQLLGHALQLAALLLLLRERVIAAALIFAASLFIKHNLLALPAAAAIFLWQQDRRAGLRFTACGLVAGGVGLLLFQQFYGFSLWTVLSTPRQASWDNLRHGVANLWWALLPMGVLIGMRGPWKRFCLIYALVALAFGLAFSAGDGVDANAFFDLAIALSLALGLAAESKAVLAPLSAVALLGFLALNFHDNNFYYTRDIAAQSARDIAFLKSRPGPVLCDQLSLCLWAGKGAEVDAFNIGEQIKTGNRSPAGLVDMIAAHHFAVVQLQDLDSLGPSVRAALTKNYRLERNDDDGAFFTPAL
ncbi:MAG TPA: hypothetical protein VFI23_06235 [Rhizomicrobium sp.]|nr:hypothetical protein [Rhizomicrobium sp.]